MSAKGKALALCAAAAHVQILVCAGGFHCCAGLQGYTEDEPALEAPFTVSNLRTKGQSAVTGLAGGVQFVL